MAFTPTSGNYPIIHGYYPDSQYVHMAIGGLARPSGDYSIAQAYVWNLSSGWSSGWYNTPPFSVSGGQTSAFPIYMTPGSTYEVQFRVLWDGTWWISSSVSFYFTPPTPKPPTAAPYVTFNGASGTRLSFNVQNTYGADYITAIGMGTDTTEYIYGTGTKYVYAGATGTEYYVGFKGYNTGGETSRVYQWVTTQPSTPSISNGGKLANGNQLINVSPSGGWSQIMVEMWNDAENIHYATRTQGWNGGSSFSVEFGAMIPNTTYKFRVKATKTSNNSSYHPDSGWSNFVPIKNTVAKPTRWEWNTPKEANQLYSMSASEWNAFALRINAFREYKGLNPYPFTNAYSGSAFRFFMFNEARAAINEMANTGLGVVTAGDSVVANSFNIMRNTLNVL